MKKAFLLLTTFTLIIACSSDSEEDSNPNNGDGDKPKEIIPTDLTFKDDIQPLISNKCMECHGKPPRSDINPSASFVTFEQIKNRADAMLARMEGFSGIMPPTSAKNGPLSQEQINNFDEWIKGGFPE